MTADEWQERLAALPHKEIQRLLKSEPTVISQISAGFRTGAESLKNPIVLKRLAEALPKNPKLAEALETVEPAPTRTHPPGPLPSSKEGGEDGGEEKREAELGKVREKLKEQRALLKEKEAQLADLSARLSQLERERDVALAERERERQAREAVGVKLEREQRRKTPEPNPPKPSLVEGGWRSEERAKPGGSKPGGSRTGELEPMALPNALSRLLVRGHDATVLALCRELLIDEALSVTMRAGVQGVYATALDNLGAPDAPEQCRAAAEAFLSAGQPLEATELFVRSLTKGTLLPSEKALLQRLLALAERHGELEGVGQRIFRQRLTQPLAFASLSKGLEALGRKYAGLLPAASTTKLTPDMPVALPTTSQRAASVTARRLVQAVDEGDRALVGSARAGLTELRASNSSLAEALLETVGTLSAPALAVLTAPRLRPVVVDASNAARHIADPLAAFMNEKKKPTASVTQLLQLREFLLRHGFFPVYCIADANLRHLVSDKPQYAALVEKQLIRETLPGTSADELMLAEARAHQAPLITNDRLADWGKQAQNIERLGFTIHKGHITLLPS